MQTGPRISKKPCVVLFSYISVEGLLCMFFNLHPIPIVFVSSTPKDQPRSPSRAWKRSPELQGKLEIFVSQPVKTWTNFGKFREYV